MRMCTCHMVQHLFEICSELLTDALSVVKAVRGEGGAMGRRRRADIADLRQAVAGKECFIDHVAGVTNPSDGLTKFLANGFATLKKFFTTGFYQPEFTFK